MLREPVVNGHFYPDSAEAISKMVEGFKSKEPSKISAKGIILPHAGYVCSGHVAVVTANKIIPKKKLIILGTNHTGYGEEFSLWAKGAWKIPSGKIDIDEELADLILAKSSLIKEDYLAHTGEHSIEVQLPILYNLFGDFKFVPITCATSSLENYRIVANDICRALKGIEDEVLLVASSDMTHYEPDAAARKKDRDALGSIIDLDEEGLLNKVSRENITMCGIAPVSVLLTAVKALGAKKAQVALYETSGDAVGDYSSVVGYAGVIIK